MRRRSFGIFSVTVDLYTSNLCDRHLSGLTLSTSYAVKQGWLIELDGGQHADSARDVVRDVYITGQGYRVVRFWNSDVFSNREGVLTVILQELTGKLVSK